MVELTKFTYHSTGTYLSVVVAGRVDDIDSVINWVKEYREAAQRQGLGRILIDYSKMDFKLDFHDLIQLANRADNVGYQRMGIRTASIISKATKENTLDFDTICSNRSIVFRSFVTREEALDWLLD